MKKRVELLMVLAFASYAIITVEVMLVVFGPLDFVTPREFSALTATHVLMFLTFCVAFVSQQPLPRRD